MGVSSIAPIRSGTPIGVEHRTAVVGEQKRQVPIRSGTPIGVEHPPPYLGTRPRRDRSALGLR